MNYSLFLLVCTFTENQTFGLSAFDSAYLVMVFQFCPFYKSDGLFALNGWKVVKKFL